MKRFIETALLASLLIGPALAQNRGGADTRPLQERRDQLARDLEGLSDGDPLMRVAVMESILKRGDASAAYLAMRAGFASDDPALRNLATADLQKQADAALLDPRQTSELFKSDWLAGWSRRGFVLAIGFTGVDLEKNSGKIWSLPTFSEQNAVDFTLTGNEIYATFQVDFIGFNSPCHVRLSPTPALTIDGIVACDYARPSPSLRVTAFMF